MASDVSFEKAKETIEKTKTAVNLCITGMIKPATLENYLQEIQNHFTSSEQAIAVVDNVFPVLKSIEENHADMDRDFDAIVSNCQTHPLNKHGLEILARNLCEKYRPHYAAAVEIIARRKQIGNIPPHLTESMRALNKADNSYQNGYQEMQDANRKMKLSEAARERAEKAHTQYVQNGGKGNEGHVKKMKTTFHKNEEHHSSWVRETKRRYEVVDSILTKIAIKPTPAQTGNANAQAAPAVPSQHPPP